jgi:hypothetical protein
MGMCAVRCKTEKPVKIKTFKLITISGLTMPNTLTAEGLHVGR